MQAISNSKQNFTGAAIILGQFSPKTSHNIEKTLPKLRKMISKKPFDLIIEEDKFSGNILKISAEKTADRNAKNLKHVTAYVSNRASNPAGLYIEAAKQVIHDYNKQYIQTGNFFERILDKFTKFFK